MRRLGTLFAAWTHGVVVPVNIHKSVHVLWVAHASGSSGEIVAELLCLQTDLLDLVEVDLVLD